MDPSEARFAPATDAIAQPPYDQGLPLDEFHPPHLNPARPHEADATLLGVPFDGTSGRSPMQRHGPALIRAALSSLTSPASTSGNLRVFDAGDVRTDPLSTQTLDTRVQGALRQIHEATPDALPVLLGGEHTISLPAVRSLQPATIVSLDAHSDLWKKTDGQKISHGTWLHHARKELECTVVLPLTRTLRGDAEQAIQHPRTNQRLSNDLPEPVYLTLDADVFDPKHAPAVAFPEPGGPSPRSVLEIVAKIASLHDLVGMDVVEVNANRLGATSRLQAAGVLTALAANRGLEPLP